MVVKDEEIEKGRGRQIKSVEEDEQMEEKLGQKREENPQPA